MRKKKFFILLCFMVLVTSILSPIASNDYVRFSESHELVGHVINVNQAKLALDMGEFPVKTAPLALSHYGYPLFQFSNSVLYTIMGVICKFLTPHNPFIALKLFLWLSLLLGVVYFYKIIFWLTESEVISFLSSIVYIMSPYLLINIFERGAIPEAIAQAIIPVVLYYSLKVFFFERFNLIYCSMAALTWFVLAGTHMVTFFYFSLFFGLFLFIFTIVNRSSFKNILFVFFSYVYAIILGSFFLIPIALFAKYTSSYNNMDMTGFQFETLLPSLLSMTPTSPMPLPGNGKIPPGMKLYVSLGLPMLIAIGSIIYLLSNQIELLSRKFKILSMGLLITFLIAFFAVWKPFDFWPYLPKIFQSAQFSWRLLTQTMWSGTILFAISVFIIFGNRLDIRHGIIGLVLICVSLSPWLTSQESGSISIEQALKNPDLGYGLYDYLVRPDAVKLYTEPVTMNVTESAAYCQPQNKVSRCDITVTAGNDNVIQLPLLYYPKMINIKVNGQKVHYFPTEFSRYVLGTIKLPAGVYIIEYYFKGFPFATWISTVAFLLLLLYLIVRFFQIGLLNFKREIF